MNFEHFSIKVDEDNKKIFYVNTTGFAYYKLKTFPFFNYIIPCDNYNRIYIKNKQFNLAKLIYKSTYSKVSVKNIVFLDSNTKNCNIENLANVKVAPKENTYIIKNNLTGQCKKITHNEFIKYIRIIDKYNLEKQEIFLKKAYLLKTYQFTICQKYAYTFNLNIAEVPKIYSSQYEKNLTA